MKIKMLIMLILIVCLNVSAFATDYMIMRGDTIKHLEENVKACIDMGWICQGGMVIDNFGEIRYCQTLLKE